MGSQRYPVSIHDWQITLVYFGAVDLQCARLGCDRKAAASLQFDSRGSRVLIVDLVEAVAGIPICGPHASTRTPPMGWTLVDERSEEARLALWADPSDEVLERPSVRRPGERSFSWTEVEHGTEDPSSPLLARAFRAS